MARASDLGWKDMAESAYLNQLHLGSAFYTIKFDLGYKGHGCGCY